MAGKSPSAVSKCPPMNLVNSSQGPGRFPFSSSLPWVFRLTLCSEVPGLQPVSGRGSGWAACCHLQKVGVWHTSLRAAPQRKLSQLWSKKRTIVKGHSTCPSLSCYSSCWSGSVRRGISLIFLKGQCWDHLLCRDHLLCSSWQEPLCLQTVEVFLSLSGSPTVMPHATKNNIDEVRCIHRGFTLLNSWQRKLLRDTSLWWLVAHLQRHECAAIHMCLPHEFKGLLEAPVTHTKIRDIYFMAVITALPERVWFRRL